MSALKPIHLVLVALVTLALLRTTAGVLTLELAEDDHSVPETDPSVNVTVTVSGDTAAPVVMEIVPLSASQVPEAVPEAVRPFDPATPDLDYSSARQQFTIQPGQTGDISIPVAIINDQISENEEFFFVALRLVNDSGTNVEIKRNLSTIYIRQDSNDGQEVVVQFNQTQLSVDEGDGEVRITIVVSGNSEPTLTINLQLQNDAGADVELVSSQIQIFPSTESAAVVFVLNDDDISGGNKMFSIILVEPSQNQANLYTIGDQRQVTITVQDNDVPRVGLVVDDDQTSVREGGSVRVCARLMESIQLDENSFIALSIIRSFPEIGTLPLVFLPLNSQFILDSDSTEECFTVFVTEDEEITAPWELTLFLNPVFTADSLTIDPNTVTLTIQDNDGIPKMPSDVSLTFINDDQDLLIEWEAFPTELQPVDLYTIELITNGAPDLGITKRQWDSGARRFTTTNTEFVVNGVDPKMEHTVRVCAENSLGRTCPEPVEHSVFGPPSNLPLLPSLPIWVYVICVLAVLLLLAVLVILIAICIFCRVKRMKNYYPAEQERKIQKMEGSDSRYQSKFSQGTLATDWELSGSFDDEDDV